MLSNPRGGALLILVGRTRAVLTVAAQLGGIWKVRLAMSRSNDYIV